MWKIRKKVFFSNKKLVINSKILENRQTSRMSLMWLLAVPPLPFSAGELF